MKRYVLFILLALGSIGVVAPTAQMRISDNVTVVLSTRDEFITGLAANSRTYAVSVAVKSVQ